MQYLFLFALLSTLGAFFSTNARRRYHHHPNVTDALDDLDDDDLDFRPTEYITPHADPRQQNLTAAPYQQVPQQPVYQPPLQVTGQTQPSVRQPSGDASESGTLMMIMMVLVIAGGLGFFWIMNLQNKGESLSSALDRLVPPPPQQTAQAEARVVRSNAPRSYLKPLLSDVYAIYLQEYSSPEGVALLAETLPVPNKIRIVQKGDAYWACIFLPSEDEAPRLLKILDQYREYGIDPMLINLRNNCAGFEYSKTVCKCGTVN